MLYVDSQVAASEVQTSVEYATNSWTICKNSVLYATKGKQCITLLEKWLRDTDPHFDNTVVGSTAVVNVATRKRRCPLQLHLSHQLLAEAYILLTEHLLFAAKSTTAAADHFKGAVAALKRALGILQGVLPANHPEVSYLQLELCRAMQYELSTKKTGPVANSKATQVCDVTPLIISVHN